MAIAGEGLPAIANSPELPQNLVFSLNAFLDLTSERQSGESLGPIPYSKIREYVEEYGVEDKDDFIAHIQALDNHYLERELDKTKALMAKNKVRNSNKGVKRGR